MKNLKIFLQYPWKFPDSSYYKNILEYPPKNVVFVNHKKSSKKKIEVIGSSKKFLKMQKIKNLLRKILGVLKIPNITYTFKKDFDLIHCAHCLSLNRKPWVMDIEAPDRMAASGKIARSKLGHWIIKKLLEGKYCKKIICWSEDCRRAFIEDFKDSKKIISKATILPFALPYPNFKKIPHKNLRILFVARWFDAKGGRQTLEVFNRLSRKYPKIEFWFICPTPREFRKKYKKNKQIKIMDLVSQETLFEKIYPGADIFFYPGFGDSYGFAVPEAMSFGIPIVTTDTFAKKEVVGEAGFLVRLPKDWRGYDDMNENFLKELMKKTEILIKNKKLREDMGRKGRKEVKRGKFSIKNRNYILKKIYQEALSG